MLIDIIKQEIKQKLYKPYRNSKGSFIYYGEKVFFPKSSVIFQRAITEGIYESDNLRIINALIKPGTEVFDIGANIGIMAIPFLRVHHDITVVSIEASPNTLPYLKKTHAANTNAGRWTIIDKAVSDKEKKINFQLAEPRDGAYDSIGDTKRITFTRLVEVDCTTIDNIWKKRNRPNISFIKIDIEGADLLALRGASECIENCKPAILVEWNQINIKAFALANLDFFNFFNSINYHCFTVPALIKVSSFQDFNLHANFTENFLLLPD